VERLGMEKAKPQKAQKLVVRHWFLVVIVDALYG
jgi:hypothetical protein